MSQFKLCAFADEANASLDGQISALKRNGIPFLEIRNVGSSNIVNLSSDEVKSIRQRLEEEGIKVWSVGSPAGKIQITDSFEPHLDTFKRLIEHGNTLGAKAMRIFSFYIPNGEEASRYRDEVLRRLDKMLEAAKGSGIFCCHENEKGIYGDNADRCLDLLSNLPSLRAVFDPANFVQCGQDTKEAWKKLSPHVEYLHIKDALADGSIVPAGKGHGNVPYIISEYGRQGGRILSLEPHLFEFAGLAALEREGDKSEVGSLNFLSAEEAFDCGANSLKEIIEI